MWLLTAFPLFVNAQIRMGIRVADLGDGTYENPVLAADYSDPDVIRVGNTFYMIASSFHVSPGLPILQSVDLVNWELIGHALPRQVPEERFSSVQHGGGVWAPALRHHRDEFYLYYPDPDAGIYLMKAQDIRGPWSSPLLVVAGKGLIDPCPLWDEDGKAYLVHAYAGSRAGIKSILVVKQMDPSGERVLDEGQIVYDGHELDPTVEGPKFYKRNGYYYIFAPAGGVATGWQIVLRSREVYGPYERKVVMHQGSSSINGPHQGAWVTTTSGEDWFLHFQDKGPYGRVVHLQPLKWLNDWPLIGVDEQKNGIGIPVTKYLKPAVRSSERKRNAPPDSDEFDRLSLGLQWQWQANPQATWAFLNKSSGFLRLYSVKQMDAAVNLWDHPALLLQKFPAEKFTVTTKLQFYPHSMLEDEIAGLTIFGLDYAYVGIKKGNGGTQLFYVQCENADKGNAEKVSLLTSVPTKAPVYLRVKVEKGGYCIFSYSLDGKVFSEVPGVFKARQGKWVGAKVGLFHLRSATTNDSGYADIDWFRFEQ